MLSEVKKDLRVQNSTLILGGRGWGRQGKGISISTMQKAAILRKCVNTFVPHCSLDKTWNNYRESIARYRSLVDENSMEIHEVNNQYASQELRKDNYDQKIKEFTIAAATHFNEQVSRDLANIGLASPTPSVRSVSSRASKLSEAGERLHNTKIVLGIDSPFLFATFTSHINLSISSPFFTWSTWYIMFFLSGLTSISFVSVLIHRSFFIFLVNFLPAVSVKARIGVPGCKQFSYQPMQRASFFTLKTPCIIMNATIIHALW